MNSSSSSLMRYNSTSGSNPFTANQWQELEHQALIYKYLISGIPVPPDLLFPLKRSSNSSSLHMGWNCYLQQHHQMLGRKIDPEPGRCRRTDGKKWRCSKEAFPDSKYCERHMHRGKNRSRKHVEQQQQQQQQQLISPTTAATPPSLTAARNNLYSLDSSDTHHHNYFLDSQLNSHYRYAYGVKDGVDEHAFFSAPSGATRNFSATPVEDSWQLTPLTMSSSSSNSSRQSDYTSYLQLQSLGDLPKQESKPSHHYFYGLGSDGKYEAPVKLEREEEPHKTIHRFFDEEPIRGRDSWLDPDDKSSNSSSTRLSISMPSSSSNDFPLFSSRRNNDGRV